MAAGTMSCAKRQESVTTDCKGRILRIVSGYVWACVAATLAGAAPCVLFLFALGPIVFFYVLAAIPVVMVLALPASIPLIWYFERHGGTHSADRYMKGGALIGSITAFVTACIFFIVGMTRNPSVPLDLNAIGYTVQYIGFLVVWCAAAGIVGGRVYGRRTGRAA